MKRICLLLLLILSAPIGFAQNSRAQMEIRNNLQRYLQQYPQAQLRDVYKTCFQDFFGPGHLLSDTLAAYSYLDNELANTKVYGGPLFEPTGYKGNYYRVNISLVADGIISRETFMHAFIRSANSENGSLMNVSDWRIVWQSIESTLKTIMLWTDECRADSEQINQMLLQNQYMMHHSKRFNETYNFHYRIIRKDIFENELLPLINK